MVKKEDPFTHAKRVAGYQAAEMAEDGMVVGLGTGSTVLYAIERLSERARDGLEFTGIPTSVQTAIRARNAGISLASLDDYPVIDVAIDGADEVDPLLRLIKGRGAAHLREKCIAAAARRFIVVVDDQKIVKKLTAPIPVEVLPFAATSVILQLRELGCIPAIREGIKKDGPVITDNGNFVVDCRFSDLREPEKTEAAIAAIPGALESGLFCGFTKKTTVIVGGPKKRKILLSPDIVA